MPRNTAQPRNPHDPAFEAFVEPTQHHDQGTDQPPAKPAKAAPRSHDAELDKMRRLTVDLPEHTRRALAAASAAAGTNAKTALRAFATAIERDDDRALSLISEPRHRQM